MSFVISNKVIFSDSPEQESLNSSQIAISCSIRSFLAEATSCSALLSLATGQAAASLVKSQGYKICSSLFQHSSAQILSSSLSYITEGISFNVASELGRSGELKIGSFADNFHGISTIILCKAMNRGVFLNNLVVQHLAQNGALMTLDVGFEATGLREQRNITLGERLLETEITSCRMEVSARFLAISCPEIALFRAKQELDHKTRSTESKTERRKWINIEFFNLSKGFFSPALASANQAHINREFLEAEKEKNKNFVFIKKMGVEHQRPSVEKPHQSRKKLSNDDLVIQHDLVEIEADSLELEVDLSTAHGEAAAKNELLAPEQIAYQLGWNRLINRQSNSIVVLEHGIGPANVDTAYTLNFKTKYGIDLFPPSREGLLLYHSHWDEIDINFKDLPPDINLEHSAQFYQRRAHWLKITSEAEFRDLFFNDLNHRKRRGFWDIKTITLWSIERLIMVELKWMGVNSNYIEIPARKDGLVELRYEWAFPGEKPKERVVIYSKKIDHIPPSTIDVFYQKSNQDKFRNDELVLQKIAHTLKPNASALLGRSYDSQFRQRVFEQNQDTLLTYFPLPVEISPLYTSMMKKHMSRLFGGDESIYGWQLYGAKRP